MNIGAASPGRPSVLETFLGVCVGFILGLIVGGMLGQSSAAARAEERQVDE